MTQTHVRRATLLSLVALLMSGAAGCSSAALQWQERWGGASLVSQFQARDGASGAVIDFADVVSRCKRADVILFGEEHNNPICNALEAALYGELVRSGHAPTLAMEFFERDVQPPLDDYLAARSSEADFRKLTRQGKAYTHSHRPLIEMARTAKLTVAAANAPRGLVREFRKSGLAFDAFRAGRSEAERTQMAAQIHPADAGYRNRFYEVMGGHSEAPSPAPAVNHATEQLTAMRPIPASEPTSAPSAANDAPSPELLNSLLNAQLLWDSTMAESIARQRERSAARPVLLVVGRFHVEQMGGTAQAVRALRSRDRVTTIVFRSHDALPTSEPTAGVGDIVIDGFATPPGKSD